MKKCDTVQLSVIIVALVVAFGAIQFLLYSVGGLVFALSAGEFVSGTFAPPLLDLLVAILEAVIAWQLIIKSRNIAEFIYEKTGIGTSFKVIAQPESLLFILLIVAGMYFLIDSLPPFIKALLNEFKSKASNRFTAESYTKADWATLFLRLLLPAVLLMVAKPLSNYFAKNVSDEPVLIGEDIGSIDENETTNQ